MYSMYISVVKMRLKSCSAKPLKSSASYEYIDLRKELELRARCRWQKRPTYSMIPLLLFPGFRFLFTEGPDLISDFGFGAKLHQA